MSGNVDEGFAHRPLKAGRVSTYVLSASKLCVLFAVVLITPTNACVLFSAAMFEKLDMPPEVAGVTFLAFGNGAPDVFSAFVALTSNMDREEGLLVGIGSLLGSSESRIPPVYCWMKISS